MFLNFLDYSKNISNDCGVFPKYAFRLLGVSLVVATLAMFGGRLLKGQSGALGHSDRAEPRALVVPVEILEVGEAPAVREVRVER